MLGPDRPLFRTPGSVKNASAAPQAAQSAAVRQFVARVGGIENARRALDMLAMLSRQVGTSS